LIVGIDILGAVFCFKIFEDLENFAVSLGRRALGLFLAGAANQRTRVLGIQF